MTQERQTGGVKTTRQSLKIVEYIADTNGATVAEIMEECGLTKSTAYNHINTLYEMEYLTRFGNKYVLGMKFLNMGAAARNRNRIYQLAGETVTELANRIEEVTDFCILEQKKVYTVFAKTLSGNESYVGMGKQFPPHSSAAGKAILAKSPPEKVEETLEKIEFSDQSENSIEHISNFMAELQRVADRGFAFNDEEYRDGLRTVAAPVILPDGRILGALTVGGPAYRIEGEYYRKTLPQEILVAVSELEEKIATEYQLNTS